jgi:ribosomal protein S18 acetylase RimI-like enzyme
MKDAVAIRKYNDITDRPQVIAIWKAIFGYSTLHNEPGLAIDKKVAMNDGLLFVALFQNQILGTIMAGYDGHRGWIYSLAVLPSHRSKGIGKLLMQHAESALQKLGCLKVNLQVLENNVGVVDFYKKLGYSMEPRISMGKILNPIS